MRGLREPVPDFWGWIGFILIYFQGNAVAAAWLTCTCFLLRSTPGFAGMACQRVRRERPARPRHEGWVFRVVGDGPRAETRRTPCPRAPSAGHGPPRAPAAPIASRGAQPQARSLPSTCPGPCSPPPPPPPHPHSPRGSSKPDFHLGYQT
jgi:hypothetical protein